MTEAGEQVCWMCLDPSQGIHYTDVLDIPWCKPCWDAIADLGFRE